MAPHPVQVYTDPLQHAAIAATVAAPLGRAAVRAAVTAALVIDLDHAVAARSVRVRDTTALATRPRTHSIVTALTAGLVVARARGSVAGLGGVQRARLALPARRGRPCCADADAVAVRTRAPARPAAAGVFTAALVARQPRRGNSFPTPDFFCLR